MTVSCSGISGRRSPPQSKWGCWTIERQRGLCPLLVEKAELDLLGDLAEQREVGAVAVERGAERIAAPWPDLDVGAVSQGTSRSRRWSRRHPSCRGPRARRPRRG